jgi:5-methylcytosine-specific restriction enzyme A
MPYAPKLPCRGPGCGQLVSESGFCPACKARGLGQRDRLTAAQRGYGSRWQKVAKAYLLQNPFAVDIYNHFGGRIVLAECVDHIIPHRGDMELFWNPSNFQGLTLADHARKTNSEDGGFGNARTKRGADLSTRGEPNRGGRG